MGDDLTEPASREQRPALSVVTTLFQSAPFLAEFYGRMVQEAGQLCSDFELIFVNDGSPDRSLEIALALQRDDPRVRVVDLSRNFGHHRAIMTGLDFARGDLVFLIDCDLEEDPAWLAVFHRELLRTGADLVYGVQVKRKGGWFERVSGALFFSALNLLSDLPVPKNPTICRLMTRRYVSAFSRHRERELAMLGLWALTGFEQVPVSVRKTKSSGTTYSLAKRIAAAVRTVTSLSDRPLIFVFYLGSAILAISVCAAAYLVVRRLFFGAYTFGWPSLIVSIWLLGGLTIFCIGIVGIYLSKVFIETKQRPYTIVREVHERERQSTD
jgi:putative glycosyltransferase